MPQDRLTIQFLQEAAAGIRRVTQSNSPVKCLLCSRPELAATSADWELRKNLDVPGVYLLLGPASVIDDARPRLYVGQADSVADRLDDHMRSKKWWDRCAVLRRADDSPLNLGQCKFIEFRLCDLATQAKRCVLENGNAPRKAHLHPDEAQETEKFLTEARFIVGSIGFDFFQASVQTPNIAIKQDGAPSMQTSMLGASQMALSLLKTLEDHINPLDFPNVQWYSTQ